MSRLVKCSRANSTASSHTATIVLYLLQPHEHEQAQHSPAHTSTRERKQAWTSPWHTSTCERKRARKRQTNEMREQGWHSPHEHEQAQPSISPAHTSSHEHTQVQTTANKPYMSASTHEHTQVQTSMQTNKSAPNGGTNEPWGWYEWAWAGMGYERARGEGELQGWYKQARAHGWDEREPGEVEMSAGMCWGRFFTCTTYFYFISHKTFQYIASHFKVTLHIFVFTIRCKLI